MSGKKFMILNSKRNYILHFLDDSAGKSSVSGVDVEYLLKPQESRTRTSIESMEKKLDEKLSSHS